MSNPYQLCMLVVSCNEHTHVETTNLINVWMNTCLVRVVYISGDASFDNVYDSFTLR